MVNKDLLVLLDLKVLVEQVDPLVLLDLKVLLVRQAVLWELLVRLGLLVVELEPLGHQEQVELLGRLELPVLRKRVVYLC